MASTATTMRGFFSSARTAAYHQRAINEFFYSPTTSTFRSNTRTRFLRPNYFSTTARTRTQHSFRPQAPKPDTAAQRLYATLRARFFSTGRRLRNAAEADPLAKPDSELSLSQRLKKLSREYGWSAVGVYFALSALDFPFCYLLVRVLGTDRIGEWEHAVVSRVAPLIPQSVKDAFYNAKNWFRKTEVEYTGDDDVSDVIDAAGWGVQEAEARMKKEASLGTQLALAYAIHKSFIFIRIPLTAAVTPKVVSLLRGWGWNIGKRSTEAEKVARRVKRMERKELKAEKKREKAAR
jgi:hypothetical protein